MPFYLQQLIKTKKNINLLALELEENGFSYKNIIFIYFLFNNSKIKLDVAKLVY